MSKIKVQDEVKEEPLEQLLKCILTKEEMLRMNLKKSKTEKCRSTKSRETLI